jgi:hypothetical protein
MKSRLILFLALGFFVAAVAGSVAWWFLPAPVRGEVTLTGFDGEQLPSAGARVALYPRELFLSHLQKELARRPAELAAADERLSLARNEWERCALQRTEAVKALRVAERTNAADLETSRARHEAALQAETAAYERLEALTREREELDNPARVFRKMADPLVDGATDEEGKFFLRAPRKTEIFLLVRARSGSRFDAVWVRPIGALREPIKLSNKELATIEALGSLVDGIAQPST